MELKLEFLSATVIFASVLTASVSAGHQILYDALMQFATRTGVVHVACCQHCFAVNECDESSVTLMYLTSHKERDTLHRYKEF